VPLQVEIVNDGPSLVDVLTAVGTVGATIAAAAAAWAALRQVRRQGERRARIDARISGVGDATRFEERFVVRITNDGLRPFRIEEIWFKDRHRQVGGSLYESSPHQLPVELADGDAATFYFKLSSLESKFGESWPRWIIAVGPQATNRSRSRQTGWSRR
jgi:hypothetical protein